LDLGKIAPETADATKQNLQALHNALISAMGREASLLQQAQTLKGTLEVRPCSTCHCECIYTFERNPLISAALALSLDVLRSGGEQSYALTTLCTHRNGLISMFLYLKTRRILDFSVAHHVIGSFAVLSSSTGLSASAVVSATRLLCMLLLTHVLLSLVLKQHVYQ